MSRIHMEYPLGCKVKVAGTEYTGTVQGYIVTDYDYENDFEVELIVRLPMEAKERFEKNLITKRAIMRGLFHFAPSDVIKL